MARSHEKASAASPGRSAHQPPQPIGETPHGALDQPVGSGDDWGYQPRKGGMALEARLGMFIIVILLGGFGFLVYRKFDQRELLASERAQEALLRSVQEDGDSDEWIRTSSASDEEPVARRGQPGDFQPALVARIHPEEDPRLTVDRDAADDADPFEGLLESDPADDSFDIDLAASEPVLSSSMEDDDFDFDSQPFNSVDHSEDVADAVPPLNDSPNDGVFERADDGSLNDLTASFDEPADNGTFTRESPDDVPLDTELDYAGAALPFADDVALDFNEDSPSLDDTKVDVSDDTPQFGSALDLADDSFRPPMDSLAAPPVHESEFPDRNTDRFDEIGSAVDVVDHEPEPSSFGPPPDIGEDSELDNLLFDEPPSQRTRQDDIVSVPEESSHLIPDADSSNEMKIVELDNVASVETSESNDSLLFDDGAFPPLPVAPRHESPAPIDSQLPLVTFDESGTDDVLRDDRHTDTSDDLIKLFPEDSDVVVRDEFPSDERVTFFDDTLDPVPDRGNPPTTVQHAVDEESLDRPVRRRIASAVSTRIIKASAEQDDCDVFEVKANDNYWKISRRAYGSTRYYAALARYNQNRIANPRHLRPGMKVLIPSAAALETRYPKLFKSTSPKDKPRSGYFVQSDGSAAYRIGERDTLSEIAERHLGRSSRWIEIYRSNRNVLPNPNRLKPGTVIALPDDATDVHVIP